MSWIIFVSIGIRLAALGWSVALLLRLRDWRLAFMSAMLALMTVRQVLTAFSPATPRTIGGSPGAEELPGLAVSILALLAVIYLAKMINDNRRTQAELSAVNEMLSRAE